MVTVREGGSRGGVAAGDSSGVLGVGVESKERIKVVAGGDAARALVKLEGFQDEYNGYKFALAMYRMGTAMTVQDQWLSVIPASAYSSHSELQG